MISWDDDMEMGAQFSPGFRISMLDVIVLIAGVIGAAAVSSWYFPGGVVISFVVGHFFLFCNVIRMSRRLELIWAAVFLALAGSAVVVDAISWPTVFLTSATLTLLLAGSEIRRPAYHGAGWKRLNPNLPHWWERHAQLSGSKVAGDRANLVR